MTKRRLRLKPRFYFIVGCTITIIALLIVIITTSGKEGTLKSETLDMTWSTKGVVIRDEVPVMTNERYDRVSFFVDEGATVADDTVVAEVYKWGYNDEVMQALLNVQKQILQVQLLQLAGIENAQLDAINTQIDAKLSAMRSISVLGEKGDMLQLENELKVLMLERKDYLAQSVQVTQELTDLYDQEKSRIAQLDEYRSEIQAKGTGLISFYFDGYEQALNAAKLDMADVALVKAALKGTVATMSPEISEKLLFRLVDAQHFYVAFITDSNAPLRVAQGESYSVTFEGDYEGEYTGIALKPKVQDKTVMNILEFNQDIGFMQDVRTVKMQIKKSASGALIDLEAIKIVDGVTNITLVENGKNRDVPIDVLCADEQNAIIRAVNQGDSVNAGQKFRRP